MKCKTLFVVSCLGLMLGCEDHPKSIQNVRGLLGPDGRPVQDRAPVTGAAPEPVREAQPEFQPLPSPFAAPAAAPAPAPQAPEPEKPPAVARDLSSELGRLIPQPSECLDLGQASKQGKVTIAVHALVSPSGRLSQVSASVPGQPSAAVRCVERRVGQATLAPDVPGAPIQVDANVAVEVVSQAPPEAAPKLPAPTSPATPSDVAQPENSELAQPDGTDFAQPSQ
ncbi:MAG: hypothetical protein QM778_10125 [Myxococcales bacterium]